MHETILISHNHGSPREKQDNAKLVELFVSTRAPPRQEADVRAGPKRVSAQIPWSSCTELTSCTHRYSQPSNNMLCLPSLPLHFYELGRKCFQFVPELGGGGGGRGRGWEGGAGDWSKGARGELGGEGLSVGLVA